MDIKLDIEVSKRSLEREAYQAFAEEPWLLDLDLDLVRDRAVGKAQGDSGSI